MLAGLPLARSRSSLWRLRWLGEAPPLCQRLEIEPPHQRRPQRTKDHQIHQPIALTRVVRHRQATQPVQAAHRLTKQALIARQPGRQPRRMATAVVVTGPRTAIAQERLDRKGSTRKRHRLPQAQHRDKDRNDNRNRQEPPEQPTGSGWQGSRCSRGSKHSHQPSAYTARGIPRLRRGARSPPWRQRLPWWYMGGEACR